MLGLLQAQWTFTGFDASAHMAEETQNLRVRAPWGIVLSVAVAGVTGYLLILALTLAIHDPHAILHHQNTAGSETPAAIAILQLSLGTRLSAYAPEAIPRAGDPTHVIVSGLTASRSLASRDPSIWLQNPVDVIDHKYIERCPGSAVTSDRDS